MTSLQLAFGLLMFAAIVLIPVALDQLHRRRRIHAAEIGIAAIAVFALTQYIRFVL